MAAKRPPNSTETLPNGALVEFWDEIGLDGNPQRRRYAVDGGKTKSISTVAKALDTDPTGLMYWAAGLTCTGVAWLASREGNELDWITSGEAIERLLRENELTWRHVRDQTAKRGSNVHELIFAALGTGGTAPNLSDLSEGERGYGQAAFAWWRDRRPEAIHVEQMTAHSEKGVAGRFDLLAEIDGERVLVDAKTREKGRARTSDHVQLAGYEACNVDCGFGPSDRKLALLLLPDGTYREVEGQASAEHFETALSAMQAGRELGGLARKAEKAAETRRESEANLAEAVTG